MPLSSRRLPFGPKPGRLIERAKVDDAKAEALKDRLKWFFQERNLKVEIARFRVVLAVSGGKRPLEITGIVDELPVEFVRGFWTQDPGKEAIRAALEAGKEIEGARLGERTKHPDSVVCDPRHIVICLGIYIY